jgi:hypothetical protein
MLSIAYRSSATAPVSEDDISAILLKSRANNRRLGLTGALMYRGERFIQILEGPDEVVRERFDLIAADPRHRDVKVISELQILERQFPEWTMGFHPVDSVSGTQLPGYEDILGRRGAERIKHAEDEAQQYLEWLGEYWLPRS